MELRKTATEPYDMLKTVKVDETLSHSKHSTGLLFLKVVGQIFMRMNASVINQHCILRTQLLSLNINLMKTTAICVITAGLGISCRKYHMTFNSRPQTEKNFMGAHHSH
jgi:hypothetical protein